MITLRDVVLKVNQLYIESAGQSDEFRTEPAFKMQGSYRNMNRLAEKVLPMMNEQELMDLVLDHYKGESQTLTTGAEANFLKFKQLIGVMSEEEAERWEEIKRTFGRNQYLQGGDQNDPVSRVVSQLSLFSGGLESIQDTLKEELSKERTTTIDTSALSADLENLRQTLAENSTNAPVAGGEAAGAVEGAPAPVSSNQMEAISAAIEKYLEQSSQASAAAEGNQQMLAERQQAMMEFIQQSNQQLAQTINQSQASAQAAQLQTALQQVGALFGNYQERVTELQGQLREAQPSEVVVDVSQQMTQNSDELIQQILDQLKTAQAQQQAEGQAPPAERQESPPAE